jgi:hypothetical protein
MDIMDKSSDPSLTALSPEFQKELEALQAKGPSLAGRLALREQFRDLQERFARSLEARGLTPEEVNKAVHAAIHLQADPDHDIATPSDESSHGFF